MLGSAADQDTSVLKHLNSKCQYVRKVFFYSHFSRGLRTDFYTNVCIDISIRLRVYKFLNQHFLVQGYFKLALRMLIFKNESFLINANFLMIKKKHHIKNICPLSGAFVELHFLFSIGCCFFGRGFCFAVCSGTFHCTAITMTAPNFQQHSKIAFKLL